MGRTGSQLITNNLGKHFRRPVFHTHNPLVEIQKDQLTVISKRKKDFDIVISIIVGRRTGEFVNYTSKDIEPFSVSHFEFAETFWHVQCHTHTIESRFPTAIIVEFESLITDSKYLFSFFGIDKHTDYKSSSKSPYNNKTLIENYDECKVWYDQLAGQTPTRPQLDMFVQTMRKNWVEPLPH